MIKCVISGGCSFTQGHELKDFVEGTYSEYTWDSLIVKELFKNSIHLRTAGGGISNPTISRRVLYTVNQQLKKYKPEDIFVLVMWTGAARKEFFFDQFNDDSEDDFLKVSHNIFVDEKHSLRSVRLFNNSMRHELDKKGHFKYLKETYLKETNQARMYYNLREIEYTKSFLDAKKINYSFSFAYNDLVTTDVTNEFVLDLFERLDLQNNFVFYNNLAFNEYVNFKRLPRGLQASHPLEEAHEQWADIVIQHIT